MTLFIFWGDNKTDVEAAAELGRTLLERNRELESTVRQQQAVIDDQTQEMEVKSKEQLTNKLTNITRERNEFLRLPLPFPGHFRQFVPFVFAGRSPFLYRLRKKRNTNVDEDKTYFYI